MPDVPSKRPLRVIIAGGGTGGHLYPGIAIAEELRERNSETGILFVGTRRGLESRVLPREGYDLRTITADKLMGRRGMQKIWALLLIPLALIQSAWIILRFRPNVVVGVGGYAAGPLVLAAASLGIPTIIHEQNVSPGFTNRVLSRFVDAVVVSFPQTAKAFPREKTLLTGNPLRRSFFLQPDDAAEAAPGVSTILVLGGSRGARRINRAVMEALPLISSWQGPVKMIHQTGEEDYCEVSAAYPTTGVEAEVKPFFHNIARCYRQAGIVVARAGATTLAELMAFGKASILIPYPYSAGGHQVSNAIELKGAGAAEVFLDEELNGPLLAGAIKKLLEDAELQKDMGCRLASYHRPDAAFKVVELIYGLALDNSIPVREKHFNSANPGEHLS